MSKDNSQQQIEPNNLSHNDQTFVNNHFSPTTEIPLTQQLSSPQLQKSSSISLMNFDNFDNFDSNNNDNNINNSNDNNNNNNNDDNNNQNKHITVILDQLHEVYEVILTFH